MITDSFSRIRIFSPLCGDDPTVRSGSMGAVNFSPLCGDDPETGAEGFRSDCFSPLCGDDPG